MKKVVQAVCVLILTAALFFHLNPKVWADNISDVENQINDLKQKIETAQTQEKSLNSEIKVMDNSIKLTELQISDTEAQIKKLEGEIGDLGGKIDRLEITLSHLTELLINRIATSYKINRVSYITLLFQANGISDLLNRAKYIQLAQEHDREVMTQVQMAKVDFAEQKTLRETKKAQQEELNKKLVVQKANLDKQKKQKQTLLTQTQSDEVTYQKMLSQALAEKEAIEAALVNGEKVGPVKAGDPIALVGNTGYPACSTGAHLHFELRKNNQWFDPAEYLKSKTVEDHQNGGSWTVGAGNWDWPLDGDIIVTQHYGLTPYSWRYTYSGGIHTGIDMYSDSTEVIRAPKDGILYSSSQNCGGSSIIKIKYIDHGDGILSFYLHVQ